MSTNFISYGKQWIDKEDIDAVIGVLKSDFLTQGPKVDEFEKAICDYTGAKYCVAVANGTAALHIAALSLDIAPDSEGITTPITFAASSNCLIYNNIKPIFADINEETYNIDFNKIKEKTNSKTKVIVVVDFAGQPVELEKIYPWAKNKGIKIIEDASHAIGSKYTDGSKVGSCKFSDLTTFSFHPVKTITTGEGGAITTNDERLYKRLLLLRSHGITKNPKLLSENPGPWYYEMQELGFNYRLTDIQAALGISQLKKLDVFGKRRREIVAKYNEEFSKIKNCIVPYEEKGYLSAFHLYVLQIDFDNIGKLRKEIMEELRKNNIGTQVHYIPVHLQPYYKKRYSYKKGDYPLAELYYDRCLSIPLYPKMTKEEVDLVIGVVKKTIC